MNKGTFDIFGKTPAEIQATANDSNKESVFFSPKAKGTPKGEYNATIRFLYNPSNPVYGSILSKVVYYLKDATGKGHYFDSTQSVGDWKGCKMAQLWKQLDDSERAIDKKNAKELNKRQVNFSLVYIIDDKTNPSNNGKIKILKYGKKLKAKLDRYINPGEGKEKIDIFNFYNGYNFDLNLTLQGDYNNYDECAFDLKPSIIPLAGITGDPKKDKSVLEAFMKDAPNLDEYAYKPLNAEQDALLESILSQWRPIASPTPTNEAESIEDFMKDLNI